jgi:hypothetical protein
MDLKAFSERGNQPILFRPLNSGFEPMPGRESVEDWLDELILCGVVPGDNVTFERVGQGTQDVYHLEFYDGARLRFTKLEPAHV